MKHLFTLITIFITVSCYAQKNATKWPQLNDNYPNVQWFQANLNHPLPNLSPRNLLDYFPQTSTLNNEQYLGIIKELNEDRNKLIDEINLKNDNNRQYMVIGGIAILIFSIILILAILIFLYKMKKGFGLFAFQAFGIVMILGSSMFLVIAGYDQQQIAPIIGLLGTIAGFIFGSGINPKNTDSHSIPLVSSSVKATSNDH